MQYLNQTSPTRGSMRAMLGGSRDQMMYGRDAGNRAPSYDGYHMDHGYGGSRQQLQPSASTGLAHNQSRFQPNSYNEQLNFNYDQYLNKDYMNQSQMIPGGSSGWAGAATSAASYKTGGIGHSSVEAARGGSRYDAMNYSNQDYLQYQIGSGLVPQQNYNQMMMDDSRFNDQIGGAKNSSMNNVSQGQSRSPYGAGGYGKSPIGAGGYGDTSMQGRMYETLNGSRYSPLNTTAGNLESNNQSMYRKSQSNSYLGGDQHLSASMARRYPLDQSTGQDYSRGQVNDNRYLDVSGNGHLARDNAMLDSRYGNSFSHKFDTPKRRNKSYMDTRETEQRGGLGGLSGMDHHRNSQYMRSPQFGVQRSSRSTNNDQLYPRGTTQHYPSYRANTANTNQSQQWGVGQGFGSNVKPDRAAAMIGSRGSYPEIGGYTGGQASTNNASKWGANRFNEAYDHLKYSKPSDQYNKSSNGLYMSYFKDRRSLSHEANKKYQGAAGTNMGQNPFSSQQIEIYRAQTMNKQQYASNETKFTAEHYRVYTDILDKLPTSKFDSGKNVLTDNEKQLLKDQMDMIQLGYPGQMSDGSGDTSISMIHMIFHFFLQSGEYSFFINRIKNIVQAKLKNGSNLNNSKQVSSYAYPNSKPLKSTSKRSLRNLQYENRSKTSLKDTSIQNNLKLDDVYIATDESIHANPIQEEGVKSAQENNEGKTKRSGLDQISYDGLAVHSKKNSDPEPSKGAAITELPYRQELSQSVPPQMAAEQLKAIMEPSAMTQASTAVSGDQTQKTVHQKNQGSVVTEEMNNQQMNSDVQEVQIDKKSLSPGRLARPLKKKSYQSSQIYNQAPPAGEKPAEPANAMQPPMEKPRLGSQEPIDKQFLFENKQDNMRNQIKSAQLTNSTERPYTLNQRSAYRYNGRGVEPLSSISNFKATDTKNIYGNSGSLTQNRYSTGVGTGAYTSTYNDNSRFKKYETGDYLNSTYNTDLAGLNLGYSANQSRDNIYDKSYQNYKSYNTQHTQQSSYKPTGINTTANPYYENRSPSPKAQRMDTGHLDNGLMTYNAFLEKNDPLPKPSSEPDSGLSMVLNEPNDDFKLTIHKMNTAEQAAAPPRMSTAANTSAAGYSQTSYSTPLASQSYKMLGRGTVNTDYASQAISKALGPRETGGLGGYGTGLGGYGTGLGSMGTGLGGGMSTAGYGGSMGTTGLGGMTGMGTAGLGGMGSTGLGGMTGMGGSMSGMGSGLGSAMGNHQSSTLNRSSYFRY